MKNLAVCRHIAFRFFLAKIEGSSEFTQFVETATLESIMPVAKTRKHEAPQIVMNHNPDILDPEEIARLAHSYWEARDGHAGSAEEDWFRAQEELFERMSTVASD
jgi:hypothetical protein